MENKPNLSSISSRRAFMKAGAAGTAVAVTVGASRGETAAEIPKTDVWVLHGTDNRKLMTKALEIIKQNGGFGKDVKTMALKVNAAWARTPEQGANTHPELVDVFLETVRKSGIKKIHIPEHPCNNAKVSFDRSGLEKAAKSNRCKMIDLKSEGKSFRTVEIPNGKKLKSAEVAGEFLDADAVVNMPVAKHHGGATLSIAMKNWMGAVKDRGYWHRTDLHQCIADFATFMKPVWTIVDATRCIMDHGPQGPAEVLKTPNLLIVSKDQVAADAYASSLFHDSPHAVKYLTYAEQMGIGVVDRNKMNIHTIEVS